MGSNKSLPPPDFAYIDVFACRPVFQEVHCISILSNIESCAR